ncbi:MULTISPECIES: NAD(+) synthase [Microbacterium]|uniref:Glutamine-dependent NAD(+) synthetase n=1 Tax=Microbacterium hominis TaxID=162426 RepID=A0A2K9DND5_9MICO|nr:MULTISPECIES: NAD(+) synthase [Microbacterium]AUG28656.1 NAD(+) synthase [Microbacterium hominis]QOC24478.1 NAD(+) synthase [Microbacterium hominis]QOC28551.1 NAD(+) synthase [Microbacterium hominis]QYF99222.1 NAD(+) synthase [Microbacterium sp. PAMC21962]
MIENLPFESVYRHGFARVAAATIPVAIADPARNAEAVIDATRALSDDAVAVAVFPELCLSGYAIDDLVMQDAVLDAVHAAIATLVEASTELRPLIAVGAPLRLDARVYNCAVLIHRGRVLGVVPKSYPLTYREFYEARWYAAGAGAPAATVLAGQEVPVGADLLFAATDVPGLVVHAEVCEDMWVPIPPSSAAALAGATVLLNLSGSPITVARADDRHLLAKAQSFRCNAAYVYAAAGIGESTNDVSWDGQTMIYESGALLAESERFPDGPRSSVADVDLDRLRQDRLRQGTFDDNRRVSAPGARTVAFTVDPPASDIGLRRALDRFPFVPDDAARLDQDCFEAFSIQVSALEQRMRAIGSPKPVIGVSGGLDSTHALLVVARAMDRMGRPRSDILAYTMPGFATSDHTKSNAIALAEAIGASIETIDIRPMATALLTGIGHPFADGEPVYDVTFENVQAGARTDFLFRLANQNGGFVVGTSDLSELALGWATYGVGDQMSHYAVNAGVPKTLIQHLIRWVIAHSDGDGTALTDEAKAVLQSVLDTEISPELVPAGQDGKVQSTEDTIGPYALHDFTLFHVLRYGLRPSKIAFLAERAWRDADAGTWPPGFPASDRYAYDRDTVVRWLRVFLRRFFGFAQFKRTAIPNGPKVLAAGSLSPRGDWRAPSDGNPAVWLAELDRALPPA